MPRYFLHIRDGRDLIMDECGSDLPDVGAAYREAREAAQEILAEQIRSGQMIKDRSFEITDAHDRVVGKLRFLDVLKLR